MVDVIQPQLFDDPPQPETPEALRQKQKHELLRAALHSTDRLQMKMLADEYAKIVLEELRPNDRYHL